jgi:hypothetical protein
MTEAHCAAVTAGGVATRIERERERERERILIGANSPWRATEAPSFHPVAILIGAQDPTSRADLCDVAHQREPR